MVVRTSFRATQLSSWKTCLLSLPQNRHRLYSSRMALKEFFVILPDIPGCSRPATRPKHLKRAAEMPGFFRMGGAYLEKHPETPEEATDEKLKFQGSAMLVVAESEEDVMEKLKVDPYVVEGVWDLSKARIWHFKTAVSQPLSASKPPF